MGRLRTEATVICPAGQRREGVRMELGTVILGIIVVGALIAAISFGWTQKGVRRNVDNSYLP